MNGIFDFANIIFIKSVSIEFIEIKKIDNVLIGQRDIILED
jgi:hypothetical protein